jgi:DNA-binding response OmpR family regulator
MMVSLQGMAGWEPQRLPSVVVVDPMFDAYAALAASARMGRLDLHMRSSGAAAMKLAGKFPVDAWLVAPELDDMSGQDFVGLLESRRADAKVAMVDVEAEGSRHRVLAEQAAREAGVDVVLSKPITVADLEELLGLPLEERRRRIAAPGRSWAALPVSVGAAVIAIAVLMIG